MLYELSRIHGSQLGQPKFILCARDVGFLDHFSALFALVARNGPYLVSSGPSQPIYSAVDRGAREELRGMPLPLSRTVIPL